MFRKQDVTNKKRYALSLIFAAFAALIAVPATSQNLDMRINAGCPKLGDPNIGKYTIDQLNRLCHGAPGSQQPDASPSTPEGGASLSCGQHKALAAFARANPGFVEGTTSQAVVDKYCGGSGDNQLPAGSQVGGNFLSGVFRFERGYYNNYSGAKGNICKTYYSGRAYVDSGLIEFNSGGHTWRGRISSNSFVSITRDGVSPRPKNHTVISGPVTNAELYNGYCGAGFFKLLPG